MSVFLICACKPEQLRLWVRPHGEDDFTFIGELAGIDVENPCALAAVADQMVEQMGWHHDRAHRAGPKEMRSRVEHIMAVVTSTTEELTAAEIAERAELPKDRRHDVYRHLRQLLASGLLVRSQTRPYTYRPSKLADAG